jgi:hypothetical protein
MTNDNWSHEEINDPLYADRRNFYRVEKWGRDGRAIASRKPGRRIASSARGSSVIDCGLRCVFWHELT